ncbi:MAG: GNAT family N-acetyltransferase [Ktedonobacterales bacterium]
MAENEQTDQIDPTTDRVLVVRPAQAADRNAIFALCAHTWDDGDYIPYVWDEWLADIAGALLVAVAGDQPVGILHVKMMTPEEAWIEGVRVDPQERRQGIARMLVSRALVVAHDRGATVARLFTHSENIASQRLFARFGFTRVAEIVNYRAPALAFADGADNIPDAAGDAAGAATPSGQDMNDAVVAPNDALAQGARLRTPGPADFERLWGWLTQSTLTPFNGGLEIADWEARALDEPTLRAYLAAGQVWTLEEWETILALAVAVDQIAEDDTTATLAVRYLDGQADYISRLSLTLREVAGDHELARVQLWLPDLLILHDAMAGAGYERQDDGAMWVYARTL